MAIVGVGDRIITRSGRESWLTRPSVPFSAWAGGTAARMAGGRSVSYQGLYEQQPWVRIVIDKLNRQIARLPLKTYRLLEGSKADGERERLRDHPFPTLLKRPQERRSPAWLKQKAAHPALLHGNGLWVKGVDRPGAAPSALIPLDYRFTVPQTDDEGQLLYWETTQTGEPRYLAPDSVVHFAWEGGIGDVGVSPLKALEVTLRAEDAAQRYQASSFEHGVRPSAVYVLPPDAEMTQDDKDDLRAKLQAQQGGVDQAFQLALVSGGGSIETLQHTAVEAELIDQRKLDREEVAAVYDIPPPLIGILDHATYSNVAEMHRMLYGMVLGPWLTMIEETIQAQLIDTYEPWATEGLFVEFDLAEVLKGNTLSEIQAIREGINTGILTPNEGRAIRNMAPSEQPGMDQFYLPANNMAPVGTQPSSDGTATTVAHHLNRVADRAHRKGMTGSDIPRFERELAQDLGDADAAQSWAARVAECTDADEIRALTPQ